MSLIESSIDRRPVTARTFTCFTSSSSLIEWRLTEFVGNVDVTIGANQQTDELLIEVAGTKHFGTCSETTINKCRALQINCIIMYTSCAVSNLLIPTLRSTEQCIRHIVVL
jgi:hypothetical protein